GGGTYTRAGDRARAEAAAALLPEPQPAPQAQFTPPPQPRPAPGPALSRPTATTTTREDTTTMSTPVQAAAEAVTEHIGTWEPVNAIDLDTFLSDLPGFFESLGAALARAADTLSEQHPVSP